MPDNKIKDDSSDKRYFMITPQLVWAISRSPYDYTLWNVIKMIAGEEGECYLSTEDLATLAMMSTGKVSQCRKYLIKEGLLTGTIRRDPGYPQPVWHLRIPDLWQRNVTWRQEFDSLADRLALKTQQKKSLHRVKPSRSEEGPSPDEGGISLGEEGPSPDETKNNHEGEPPENQNEEPPFFDDLQPAQSNDLPPATDGHQLAIDRANGSKTIEPAQEIAKHLFWGFERGPADLPPGKEWKKWHEGGKRLLRRLPKELTTHEIIGRIDTWFTDADSKDAFWHDNPLHDTALDIIARFVKNGGKHANSKQQGVSRRVPGYSIADPAGYHDQLPDDEDAQRAG